MGKVWGVGKIFFVLFSSLLLMHKLYPLNLSRIRSLKLKLPRYLQPKLFYLLKKMIFKSSATVVIKNSGSKNCHLGCLPSPVASLPWGRKPQLPSERGGPQVTGTSQNENDNSQCRDGFTGKGTELKFQGFSLARSWKGPKPRCHGFMFLYRTVEWLNCHSRWWRTRLKGFGEGAQLQ